MPQNSNRSAPLRFISVAFAIALALIATTPVSAQSSLTVALYPYVPRAAQFETVIRAAWAQVQPNVQLNFINDLNVWDGGYDKDPPAQADVFVFDTMYFEQFRANNFLASMTPNEIQNAGDFLTYARDAVIVSGNYFAIPQLGCANILFYNANDTGVANATTLGALRSALNQCTFTSEIPPDRRGLMLDMAGKTTNATIYLDIAHSANGTYPLPQPAQPNASYIDNQKTILNMSSFWDITSSNKNAYIRGVWYSQGYGRAFMGFTETMSNMTPAALSTIGFKVMPLSNTTGNRPLFYVDAIGVNTSTAQRGTRMLAVQLANLIASTDVTVASFQAGQGSSNPQYLMSVRNSVFQTLGQRYPIYQRMYHLAQTGNPLAFKLDSNARSWVAATGSTIRTDVRSNQVCGCDQTSPQQISSNSAAQAICPGICSTHGGWNGQWTNQPPAPGSVCGCNACPLN
ncbi:MAG: thiamine pyridinylase [Pseudolabrys sp.]